MIGVILLTLLLEEICSEWHHTPYGTKAPYDQVAGNILDANFGECQPVKLFGIHRHGTRNVGSKTVRRLDFFINALKDFYHLPGVMPDEFSWVKDYTHNLHPNKDLVLEGYVEVSEIGRRFSTKFPELFHDADSVRYFASSYKGRCISSALSYIYGVYGSDDYVVANASGIKAVTPDIQRHCGRMCAVYDLLKPKDRAILPFNHAQNHLLRYYDECTNYKKKEEDKQTWMEAGERYLKSAAMAALTSRVGGRLNVTMTPYDVITAHILCDTEVLLPRLMGSSSRWCSLFRDDDLYVSAVYFDLIRYSRRMMPEAVDASCILWQKALSHLTSPKVSSGVTLMFAHTETLFPLLKHIGYLSDTPMTADANIHSREFFGDLTPMASNLVMVALSCPSHLTQTPVRFFLNEREIHLPGCESDTCTLEDLRSTFPSEGCDYEATCSYDALAFYVQCVAAVVVSVCLADVVKRKILL